MWGMRGKVDVRAAGRSDREVLLGFHKDLYQTYRDRVVSSADRMLIDYENYEDVLINDLEMLLADPSARVLLAEREGVAVGYITGRIITEVGRTLPRRGTVEDWFVGEAHRGSGVGTKLLEGLEEAFRASGCEVVESATWAANGVGRRAHVALGFAEIRVIYRKRLR